MDEHSCELVETLHWAVRLAVLERMGAWGYTDFYVLADEAKIRRRLLIEASPGEAVAHHLLIVAGSRKDAIVRVGAALPPDWTALPTIHVDGGGDVMVSGPTQGAFLVALTECVRTAVARALAVFQANACGLE
jgi:hypothetical protein